MKIMQLYYFRILYWIAAFQSVYSVLNKGVLPQVDPGISSKTLTLLKIFIDILHRIILLCVICDDITRNVLQLEQLTICIVSYISNYGLSRSTLIGRRYWPLPAISRKLSNFFESIITLL